MLEAGEGPGISKGALVTRRERVFPNPVIKEWMRHKTEEVSSLPFFLPGLYQKNYA
jgi:hypothetical protein